MRVLGQRLGPLGVVHREALNASEGSNPQADVCGYVGIGDSGLRMEILRAANHLAISFVTVSAPTDLPLPEEERTVRRLLLLGSRFGDGDLTAASVRAFRERDPLLPIVLCTLRRDPIKYRLAELCRAGLDQLLFIDDASSASRDASSASRDIAWQLSNRFTHILPQCCSPELSYPIPQMGALTESWCVRNAFHHLLVHDVARHFRIHRTTALRHLRETGWRSTEILIAHARLLHVARWLDDTSCTVERIAGLLAFAEPSALHHLVRSLTNTTPLALREKGAVMTVHHLWHTRTKPSG